MTNRGDEQVRALHVRSDAARRLPPRLEHTPRLTSFVAHHRRPLARITWVARYFRLAAYMGGVVTAALYGGVAFGMEPFRTAVEGDPVGVALLPLMAVGWWFTGRLLDERRRADGWMAIVNLLPPALFAVATIGSGTINLSAIVSRAVGTVAVLTGWRDLDA